MLVPSGSWRYPPCSILGMTPDERAQLVEDIKRSDNLRRGIIERAEHSKDFDLLAAWEEVDKIDVSINKRIIAARSER